MYNFFPRKSIVWDKRADDQNKGERLGGGKNPHRACIMEDCRLEGFGEEVSELTTEIGRPTSPDVLPRLQGASPSPGCSSGPVDKEVTAAVDRDLSPAANGEREDGLRTTRGRRRQGSPYADGSGAGYRRRAGQDMTRALKTWMYENRGNPYPSKEEKTALAMDSEMTLVQVSNWFANARRRLKNIVRQPGLSWSKRIQLYNVHACAEEDGADVGSVTSSVSDTAEEADRAASDPSGLQPFKGFDEGPRAPSTTANEEAPCPQFLPPPPVAEYQSRTAQHHQQRYAAQQQSMLHRYLADSVHQRGAAHQQPLPFRRHVHDPYWGKERAPPLARTSESGSLSSHDYEDVSCSPGGPETARHQPVFTDISNDATGRLSQLPAACATTHGDVFYHNDDEETYWKEITAAIVLTNMALAKRQKSVLQI